MPLEAPESGTTFVHVPLSEPLYAVVCGQPASYRTHWVKSKRGKGVKPVRCVAGDGETCVACNLGLGYNVRYMVPVRVAQLRDGVPARDERGRESRLLVTSTDIRVFECGKPQYGWVSIREMRRDWIGHEFRARRERPQRNAVIEVAGIGWQEVAADDQLDAEAAAYEEGRQQYWAWVREQSSERFEASAAPLGLDGI